MALHWNVKEVSDREGEDYIWRNSGTEETPDKRMSGITECLIWATMFVGISKITDDNWRDFAQRLRAWEKAVGCISTSGEPISAEHVRRHVGLSTNASSLTAAKFAKQMTEAALREAKRETERELEKVKKEATS